MQSIKFVEAHSGNKKRSLYLRPGVHKHHLQAGEDESCYPRHFRKSWRDGGEYLTNDQHKDLKADFIMANPPSIRKSGEPITNLRMIPVGAGTKFRLRATPTTVGY